MEVGGSIFTRNAVAAIPTEINRTDVIVIRLEYLFSVLKASRDIHAGWRRADRMERPAAQSGTAGRMAFKVDVLKEKASWR
jgi:hypothetical protein